MIYRYSFVKTSEIPPLSFATVNIQMYVTIVWTSCCLYRSWFLQVLMSEFLIELKLVRYIKNRNALSIIFC